MNRFLHRHILLPGFETVLKRRKTFAYWRELEQSQWLPPAQIETLQFTALRRLLAHAFENSAYYRESWSALGLHPRQLHSPADFARWPTLDRDTIRAHRPRMRAAGEFRLITKSTGGSSGVPLQFDLDTNSNDRRTAAWHRGYSWAGAGPGTSQLYLWGAPVTRQSMRSKIKDGLYQKLHRRKVISCFDRGENLAERFTAEVDRYRPDVIVAYTNPLYEVARRLEQTNRRPSHQVAGIVTGAEKLHDFQRKVIENVFRTRVWETYGSREFMLIGAECECHCGLHLTAEQLLVEVLDDDGQPTPAGVEGNVVITDLYNYGMPFIRYTNGDRAIAGWETCQCGRGLPLMKKVVGRRLDMLIGSGGRLIPGEFFPHLVKDFPAVSRFQVIQEDPHRVRFSLVASGMSPGEGAALEHLVRSAMGPDVQVVFEPVSHIPLTPAGKLQVVVNRVPRMRAA